jgi:tetratricopeptide (TPR) repeat protein
MAAPSPAPLYDAVERPVWKRLWWVAPVAVLAAGGYWWHAWTAKSREVAGYVRSFADVREQYAARYRKPLDSPELQRQFEHAAELATQGQYAAAAALLESVSAKTGVPAVFNDLGVLYAKLNDRARAVNAFHEALTLDIRYSPARSNMNRLRGFTTDIDAPVTGEIEPNNSNIMANLIALGSRVDAAISSGVGDVDCFRFTAPPPPRDILSIEIANRSRTLAPVLTVFDGNMRMLDWGKEMRQPGASLTVFVAPEPGGTFYLDVSGYASTGGAYTVSVRPLKAFDEYEPNDDILHATQIAPDRTVEANIMDMHDTDFYSFTAPRTGTVSIDVQNLSSTLIPALSTFSPDMRFSGFGPDVRASGASLHHTMKVEQGRTYYLQVWPQGISSGEYSLTVE